jgi:hypothetical protein
MLHPQLKRIVTLFPTGNDASLNIQQAGEVGSNHPSDLVGVHTCRYGNSDIQRIDNVLGGKMEAVAYLRLFQRLGGPLNERAQYFQIVWRGLPRLEAGQCSLQGIGDGHIKTKLYWKTAGLTAANADYMLKF